MRGRSIMKEARESVSPREEAPPVTPGKSEAKSSGNGDGDGDGCKSSGQIILSSPRATAPALVFYLDQELYRRHFEREYCAGPLTTHDGISVRFRKDNFDHCCFKSTRRDKIKDSFCLDRAQRLDWIRHALLLPSAELYVGWDGKRYDENRRVAIVENSFVTVIMMTDWEKDWAKFCTAYYCKDKATIYKIRQGPKWSDWHRA